jgi:hypothetical protein
MKIKRYKMPKGAPVASVDVRQLSGADEIMAAQMTDAIRDDYETASQLMEASHQEAIRLSLVAINEAPVQVEQTFEIDGWRRPFRKALAAFFGDMNGIDLPALKKLADAGVPLVEDGGKVGMRFQLPEGLDLAEVEIWEITGADELAAGAEVDKHRRAGIAERVLRHRHALMTRSMRIHAQWDAWSLATSTALSILYERVNGVPEEEISGLLAAAEEVSDATAAETSSPTSEEEDLASG